MNATFNDYVAACADSETARKKLRRLNGKPGVWAAFDAYIAARDEAWRVYLALKADRAQAAGAAS